MHNLFQICLSLHCFMNKKGIQTRFYQHHFPIYEGKMHTLYQNCKQVHCVLNNKGMCRRC